MFSTINHKLGTSLAIALALLGALLIGGWAGASVLDSPPPMRRDAPLKPDARTIKYSYDDAGRLTGADYGKKEIAYAYDKSGNAQSIKMIGGNTKTPTPTATRTKKPTKTPTLTATPTFTPTPCAAAPDKPKLKAPAKDATVSTQRVALDWTDAACATWYGVEIHQGKATGKLVDSKYDLTASKFKTKKLAAGKNYYWRAQACNAIGCSEWTGDRKFTIAAGAREP